MRGCTRLVITVFLLLSVADAGAFVRLRHRQEPEDTVALKCRGVLEGFPKVADGFEERLAFYRSKGLTHYFYCPSDDRYCNRWGWKFLYNDSDRHEVRRLSSLCRENGFEFVWTVDPGERYSWSRDDYKFLLDKLIMMYYNGLRSFAVRFSGNEGDHAAVRDSLMKDFVATRKEGVSLYMMADVPEVNYPFVGRTAVESLMQGYRFDEAFVSQARRTDAVVCNLEAFDEFAKLAVAATGDFARNPGVYSPDQSMADAVSAFDDDLREAFLTFLRHVGNDDKASSVEVFSIDSWSKEKSDRLYEEFDRIEKVYSEIAGKAHSVVIDALNPWLAEFERLGTRGKKVLKCMDHYVNGDLGKLWIDYLGTVMTPEQEMSYAANPVGADRLHPFCVNAMRQMKEGFASMLTGKVMFSGSDLDFSTSLNTEGHVEFAIPEGASVCHLLTGPVPADRLVLFRELSADGSLVAEFVLKSPFSTFALKEGAVKVDVLGEITIYENIFVNL